MNDDEVNLRARVLANPTSKSTHERYAEHLDRTGQSSLAGYVRLFAQILVADPNDPEFCQLQVARKEYLDSDPSCFQWDDFLAARHAASYGPEIVKRSVAVGQRLGVRPKPADEPAVQALESRIGIELPAGYRCFLTEISDGSSFDTGMFTFDPLIFSVSQIVENLDASELDQQRARSECGFTWEWMMGKDDLEHDGFNELVHPDRDDETPSGFLQIGTGYASYYLGLRGDLRGTLWATVDHYSAPMRLEEARQGAFASATCGESVRRLPFDAITAVYELVMQRWQDIEDLPNEANR